MARVSKPPEIRRQELVDIALKLFMEKGYEAVSVRDILNVVKGHPGMFYYYFSSKQDIYNEAMRQLVQKELDKRTGILCDQSKSAKIRMKELTGQILSSIVNFYNFFGSVDSVAYQTTVLLNMLTGMAEPISKFMLEVCEEGILPAEIGLNEETAYPMALFMIYGCFGIIHANETENVLENTRFLIPFIARFLGIPEEMLK